MEALEKFNGRERLYELTLDEHDLDILFDLDSQGVCSNYTKSGARFQLFPHPSLFSESFEILPVDSDTYYAYFGDIKIKDYSALESLILSREKIPIEMPSVISNDENINLGYVNIKINRK